MSGIPINSNKVVGRDVSDEKRKVPYFCAPLNVTVNLESLPDVETHQPGSLHSLTLCSHTAVRLHDNNLTRVWRTL